MPVRLVYEHTGSLQSRLCRSSLRPPSCQKQDGKTKKRRGRPSAPCTICSSTPGTQTGLCNQKNVVYRLQCGACQEQYIGETGRSLGTRAAEHHADARYQRKGTPWGDHYRRCHSNTQLGAQSAFAAVRVVARESDRARRKLREAVEIREGTPRINTSSGWMLT